MSRLEGCKALAGLDPETRDHVLEIAVAIATEPQPVAGLTRQQARIVQILRSARGRSVSYESIADAVAADGTDPPSTKSICAQLSLMRGHPLRAQIETCGAGRGRRGQARWVGARAG